MTKKLCRTRTNHGTLDYDWTERGMWGNLFFFLRNQNLCSCLFSHVCLFVCSSVYRVCERKREWQRERDDTGMDIWVNTSKGGTVTINASNLMWHAMIWAHFHWVDSSWSPAGRSTVRGDSQLANSHHQRNYIHKHSLLSCRVPFDLPLTLIWASWNICCRSFHLSISLRSHNQITGCSPVSRSSSQNKDILSTNSGDWYSVIL